MNDLSMNEKNTRSYLNDLFVQAIGLADPANCLPAFLPEPPVGKTLVVAIGKAAASMAKAAEDAWPDKAEISGIALTRYEHGLDCSTIEVVEAAHPVPDNRGYEYSRKIIEQVQDLTEDDLLLFLVSGGGSALMTLPAEAVSLDEKKQINKALLMSGAPIGEMNVVRKHLSAVKGGRLAALAAPAKVVTLAISDVPGDDPSTIASGPTVPDSSTSADAVTIIDKYGIKVSDDVTDWLQSPESETPKPDDPAFANTDYVLISRPDDMTDGIAETLADTGYEVHNLGADVEGEARDVAQQHAEAALNLAGGKHIILSGGETTVTVADGSDAGRGGRNCEYLLALAIALDSAAGVYALAADTDGIDGSETNAGAIITPDTLTRAAEKGLDAKAYLERHDSYSFFEALGDLIVTGPTRTNVNDFRVILTG